MIKIFTLAIIAVIIGVIIRINSEELYLPFKLFVGSVMLAVILKEATDSFESFFNTVNLYSFEKELIIGMLKVSAISVITKLSCDICRESGNFFVEGIVEFGGRTMIFIISLPYITRLLTLALSFID